VERYFIKNTEDILITHANVLQTFLASELKEQQSLSTHLNKMIRKLGKDINARITIVDLDGQVIADTERSPEILENHSDRPEIEEAYRGNIGKSIRYSSSIGTKMMYIAVPVINGNTISAVLRLALPLSQIGNLSKYIWGIILSSTLTGLIIAFIMSTIFSRRITKPIEEVAQGAKGIAQGNYDMKIPVRTSGEIKILAESFNHMADNLHKTISELKDGKDKTEAVLGSMAESLVAVDNKCRIIMVNSAAEKLFKIERDKVLGKHLLEMLRNGELYDLVNDVLTTEKSITQELKIIASEEKIFRINIVPINAEKSSGAVAILRDITDLRKLEKVRTEFVANVSHELKTPLTSISGFVETLLDGAYKSQDHCLYFLDIIKQETDRMTRLINELLYFSRIETADISFNKIPVDLINVVMKALSVLQTAINEKKHKINLHLPDTVKPILSDEDSLLQIMINLLDNAVKYTPDGGKINITLDETSDQVVITVADNGVGIAENELDRIFERFYRVDRARAGEISGTGLGLAMVKHLVKGLDGKITVDSELGKGTTFRVYIPKA
ncbi:MAG: cell wall metabolism sensor histidine kinase WalK, partial [Thermoanaerobacteraceae bacterium]|nr:cell wall metabolism sensor histidine kinase WalK [Thermoanaerobacteraceae bacterium]